TAETTSGRPSWASSATTATKTMKPVVNRPKPLPSSRAAARSRRLMPGSILKDAVCAVDAALLPRRPEDGEDRAKRRDHGRAEQVEGDAEKIVADACAEEHGKQAEAGAGDENGKCGDAALPPPAPVAAPRRHHFLTDESL